MLAFPSNHYKDKIRGRKSTPKLSAYEEEAWAPDQVVVDALTKKGSLYHHGQIFSCTYEECKDLEIVAAWHTYHIVDMLLGDDKWDKCMDRPQDV